MRSPSRGRAARVVIIEEQALVLEGFRCLLDAADGVDVIGVGSSFDHAAELVDTLQPSTLMLDTRLVSDDELDRLVEHCHADSARHCHVLLVAAATTSDAVRNALALGVDGYIKTSARASELLVAIECLERGETYVQPNLGAELVLSENETRRLTHREREIARMMALGYTNRQLAEIACLSTRTIESHRSNIFGKLGLTHRSDLVRWALQNGVIGPGITKHDLRAGATSNQA